MDTAEGHQIAKTCSKVEPAFELLSRKWVGLIVSTLIEGELYFCDLEKALPNLSSRVLSVRMKELEEEGLVQRLVHSGPPIRVSYGLTEKGQALQPVINAIKNWAYSFD